MKKWEIKSVRHLKELLINNEDFRNQLINDPEKTLLESETKPGPLGWDKWIYRITVGGLIAITLTIIISVVIIYEKQNGTAFEVPDLFVAIGSGAIGALAGLLTPTPTEKQEE